MRNGEVPLVQTEAYHSQTSLHPLCTLHPGVSWVLSTAFGIHIDVLLLPSSYIRQHNPKVPFSFCCGSPVLKPEPVPGPHLWSTSSYLWGNCQARIAERSASAAGACLLWIPGFLVLLFQQLSCFLLGGLFPSSPTNVTRKPAHQTVGTASWRMRMSCEML